MTPPLFDASAIRDRVQALGDSAAARPHHLLSFGVRGIQGLLLASRRQPAIRGASKLVKAFDTDAGNLPGAVFAAGGHGLLLVPATDSEAMRNQLRSLYRDRLPALVPFELGPAVPFDPAEEAACLAWLDRVDAAQRDTAPRPRLALPVADRDALCPSCFQRPHDSSVRVAWPEEESGRAAVCGPCGLLFAAGGAGGQVTNLEDLAPEGRLAFVSLDGNGVGRFFSSLGTLEGRALASAAVGSVFSRAVERARDLAPHAVLAAISGGDDARIFLDAQHLARFVRRFYDEFVSARAEAVRLLEGTEPAAGIAELEVGIGVVVAHRSFPAPRLARLARGLERSAKRLAAARRPASAIDLAFLTNDEVAGGLAQASPMLLGGAVRRGELGWAGFVERAERLTEVPTSQRSLLLQARREPETFDNLFRYQVARSPAWKRYLGGIGADWRDGEVLGGYAPDHRVHEMASLLEGR